MFSSNTQTTTRVAAWRRVYWVLTAIFIATAALNLLHVRAGVLTNHAADLVVPAWLYITVRGLAGHRHRLRSTVGRSPETAALLLFVASTATELSQKWWPHGLFRGRFDPLDIAAYAAGLLACYAADRFTSDPQPARSR